MPRLLSIAAGLLALFVIGSQQLGALAASGTIIKLATLAPSGTSYDLILRQMGEKWLKATNGTVTLRVYPGGSQGSEADVVRRYIAFRDALAPLGLAPTQVMLSSRLSWQVRLSSGFTLQLGRDTEKDRVEDRVARFASVYPQTLGRSRQRVDYVDLRYPNGFAVHATERAIEIRAADPHAHGRA